VSLFGLLGPFFFILTGLMYLIRRITGKKVWNGTLKETGEKFQLEEA
jgi:hypothetical protein